MSSAKKPMPGKTEKGIIPLDRTIMMIVNFPQNSLLIPPAPAALGREAVHL